MLQERQISTKRELSEAKLTTLYRSFSSIVAQGDLIVPKDSSSIISYTPSNQISYFYKRLGSRITLFIDSTDTP